LAAPLDDTVLRLEGSSYQRDSAEGRVGAGGSSVWTFEALCIGWTTVHFRYRQPWMPADDAADTQAIYTVVVR
jgi:predicted secreted protein